MPKEVNLTGDQVVALTKRYLSPEDVALVQKALVYAVDRHRGSHILFIRFKLQEF